LALDNGLQSSGLLRNDPFRVPPEIVTAELVVLQPESVPVTAEAP
jgi:hypothetical protein